MTYLKKIIPLTLLALVGSGCTANMSDRIKEQLVIQTGSFHRLKAKNIVRESLNNPSSEFTLALESKNIYSGEHPIHVLKGYMIPPGERMIFALIDPITGTISPEFEFEELSTGRVKVFGKNGTYETDEIPFITAEGVMSGKPVQYAIASKRAKTSAIATFIPMPLEVQSAEGKHLSVVVSHPMKTRFLLSGSGFQPGETVSLQHKSDELEETLQAVASEEGTIELELKPYNIGKLGGEASIVYNELTLAYPWGTSLEKVNHSAKGAFPVLFVINDRANVIDDSKIQKAFASVQFNF